MASIFLVERTMGKKNNNGKQFEGAEATMHKMNGRNRREVYVSELLVKASRDIVPEQGLKESYTLQLPSAVTALTLKDSPHVPPMRQRQRGANDSPSAS